jgi:hypothetical protein
MASTNPTHMATGIGKVLCGLPGATNITFASPEVVTCRRCLALLGGPKPIFTLAAQRALLDLVAESIASAEAEGDFTVLVSDGWNVGRPRTHEQAGRLADYLTARCRRALNATFA